jgi:hypothetical protein
MISKDEFKICSAFQNSERKFIMEYGIRYSMLSCTTNVHAQRNLLHLKAVVYIHQWKELQCLVL